MNPSQILANARIFRVPVMEPSLHNLISMADDCGVSPESLSSFILNREFGGGELAHDDLGSGDYILELEARQNSSEAKG